MGMSDFLRAMLPNGLRPDPLDVSVWARLRRVPYMARVKRQTFPGSAEQLRNSDLFKSWWYYSIELLPGLITKGIYWPELPFLPRMLVRHCSLAGSDCLDLGSMEGMMPTLMCKQGARSVLATDAMFHCYEKLLAVKHYYKVDFDFQQIGLIYGLSDKLGRRGGFDFINLSGLLYHVFSPMHVLAGVRPLLRKNGLMIESTNVISDDDYRMQFNDRGLLQREEQTFWYLSAPLFEYLLRFFRLEPIDCLYHPYSEGDDVRFVKDKQAGYLSVVCRATDNIALASDDWAARAASGSWEYTALCDYRMLSSQKPAHISYRREWSGGLRQDNCPINLSAALQEQEPVVRAERPEDSHILALQDRC
jgi:2-polyprenyl-3-methyl-5-hydroxy-6-metoxy-1,4-benzoquinol methylase